MTTIAAARRRLLIELAKDSPRDPVLAAVQRQRIARLRADVRVETNRAAFLRAWAARGRPQFWMGR